MAVTSRQLQTLMKDDIPQLTGKLNTIGDNFALISNNLKEIDYAAAMQKVDATLNNVKMITDKLNQKDNTVGLLLNDPSLYNNLNATTANAASFIGRLEIASETIRPFLPIRPRKISKRWTLYRFCLNNKSIKELKGKPSFALYKERKRAFSCSGHRKKTRDAKLHKPLYDKVLDKCNTPYIRSILIVTDK